MGTDAQIAAPAPAAPRESESPPSLWERIKAYLRKVLPAPIAGLIEFRLGRLAVATATAFVLILFMPLLSIGALAAVVKVLPDAFGKWSHETYVATVHTGYDIDKVGKQLKEAAAQDVLERLSENNKSLDYVQFLEFSLSRRDQPKLIPLNLQFGQHVKVSVLRNQVVARAPDCQVPDLSPGQTILDVRLSTLTVGSIVQGEGLADDRQMDLNDEWWKQNDGKLRAGARGVGSLTFAKDKDFQLAMSDCHSLQVAAVVEVFKHSPGAPK